MVSHRQPPGAGPVRLGTPEASSRPGRPGRHRGEGDRPLVWGRKTGVVASLTGVTVVALSAAMIAPPPWLVNGPKPESSSGSHAGSATAGAGASDAPTDPAGLPAPTVSREPGTERVHHHLLDAGSSAPQQRADTAETGEPAAPIPEAGNGEFVLADATNSTSVADPTVTYEIQVEEGLPFDVPSTAATIDAILSHPRGWSGGGHRPQHVDNGDFRIVIATPETTDALCAPLQTRGRLSCRNGDDVVINAWRWQNGSEDYVDQLENYRIYVINHEVGHVLGHGHRPCPGAGQPAPVMQQQTKGLDNCQPNVWPLPEELDHS